MGSPGLCTPAPEGPPRPGGTAVAAAGSAAPPCWGSNRWLWMGRAADRHPAVAGVLPAGLSFTVPCRSRSQPQGSVMPYRSNSYPMCEQRPTGAVPSPTGEQCPTNADPRAHLIWGCGSSPLGCEPTWRRQRQPRSSRGRCTTGAVLEVQPCRPSAPGLWLQAPTVSGSRAQDADSHQRRCQGGDVGLTSCLPQNHW